MSPAQTDSGVKDLQVFSKSVAKRGKDPVFLPGSPLMHPTALGQATEEMGRFPSLEVFKAWLSKATVTLISC